MSLAHGPSIVTNGLILYYDMYNTKKSFKGAPITNYIPNPYASWNGSSFVLGYNYANLGATYTYVTGVENPINSPGVLQYYTGTSGYKYFSIDSSSLPATGTYTFSYYARLVNGTASGAPIDSQLWRANGSDRSVTGDWNPTFTASWRRYATTGPAEASTVLQYFPVHSGNIIGGYTIQYCGFQLELNSYATTFVSGTRSATQSIIDLTGRNTLNASGLTYNSNNTFSFANNYAAGIEAPNTNFTGLTDLTMNCIMKYTGTQDHYTGAFMSSGDWNVNHWAFGINQSGTGIDLRRPYLNYSYSFTINQWYMVTWVRSGTSNTIYVNGTSIGSQTSSDGIPLVSNASTTMFGRETYAGGYFNLQGELPMSQIYNRALSANEIVRNFNAIRGLYGI
jgi:hypothetical protein